MTRVPARSGRGRPAPAAPIWVQRHDAGHASAASVEASVDASAEAVLAAARTLLADTGLALPPGFSEQYAWSASLPDGCAVADGRLRIEAETQARLLAGLTRRFTLADPTSPEALPIAPETLAFGATPAPGLLWSRDVASGRHVRQPPTRADVLALQQVAAHAAGLAVSPSAAALFVPDLDVAERLALWAGLDRRPLIFHPACGLDVRAAIAATRLADTAGAGERLMVALPVSRCLSLEAGTLAALEHACAADVALLIAPVLIIGSNAPADVTGALVRFAAESIGFACLAANARPAGRVMLGLQVADASSRTGLALPSTAAALAVEAGAIRIAHALGFAFAALGPFTAARGADALGFADTALHVASAATGGANLILAAGGCDLDEGISPEKLLVDAALARDLLRRELVVQGLSDRTAASAAQRIATEAAATGTFLHTAEARARAADVHPRHGLDDLVHEAWLASREPSGIGELARAVVAVAAVPIDPALAQGIEALARRIEVQAKAAGVDGLAPFGPSARLNDLASRLYSESLRDAFGFRGG